MSTEGFTWHVKSIIKRHEEKPQRNEIYFYSPTQSHQSYCHWYWTSSRFSCIRWTHRIGGFVCVVGCIDAQSVTSERPWKVFSFPNSLWIAFFFKEQLRRSVWTMKIYLERDFLTCKSQTRCRVSNAYTEWRALFLCTHITFKQKIILARPTHHW